MIFWNIAGLLKEERVTVKYLKTFDIIGLCETWVEEKDKEKI